MSRVARYPTEHGYPTQYAIARGIASHSHAAWSPPRYHTAPRSSFSLQSDVCFDFRLTLSFQFQLPCGGMRTSMRVKWSRVARSIRPTTSVELTCGQLAACAGLTREDTRSTPAGAAPAEGRNGLPLHRRKRGRRVRRMLGALYCVGYHQSSGGWKGTRAQVRDARGRPRPEGY